MSLETSREVTSTSWEQNPATTMYPSLVEDNGSTRATSGSGRRIMHEVSMLPLVRPVVHNTSMGGAMLEAVDDLTQMGRSLSRLLITEQYSHGEERALLQIIKNTVVLVAALPVVIVAIPTSVAVGFANGIIHTPERVMQSFSPKQN